jgi:hypothetical protein
LCRIVTIWDDDKLPAFYDRIMRLDKHIRFAALVDGDGRILQGGMREGVEPIEPLEKTPHLIAKLVSVQKAEDLADFFGKPEYSILVHEEIMALIFRSGKRFALITTDRKFPFTKIIRLRNQVIKK